MSGGPDHGVQNLQSFCELLERTVEQVREGNGALDSRSEALEELGGRAAKAMGLIITEIDEERGEMDAAHRGATAALEGLERAAQEAAESDLAGMAGALDEAEAASAQAQSAAQAELETGLGRLIAEGYGPLAATVDELEERAAELQRENQSATHALAAGLDALRAEAVGAPADATRALMNEFTREAVRATEGWSRERLELTRGCTEIGTDLADLYGEWGAESEREADALIREMAELGLEVADFLGTDGAMQLETSARGALAEPLSRLRDGLTEAEAVITASASAGWELEGLVPQLVICMNVVENINRLLEEMG